LTARRRREELASVFDLRREIPDSALADEFEGEPMVQSFAVAEPPGRVWITTAEALAIEGFGREWVAARLEALAEELDLAPALAAGLRLTAERAPLLLAA
jgi:hypothetical protein